MVDRVPHQSPSWAGRDEVEQVTAVAVQSAHGVHQVGRGHRFRDRLVRFSHHQKRSLIAPRSSSPGPSEIAWGTRVIASLHQCFDVIRCQRLGVDLGQTSALTGRRRMHPLIG